MILSALLISTVILIASPYIRESCCCFGTAFVIILIGTLFFTGTVTLFYSIFKEENRFLVAATIFFVTLIILGYYFSSTFDDYRNKRDWMAISDSHVFYNTTSQNIYGYLKAANTDYLLYNCSASLREDEERVGSYTSYLERYKIDFVETPEMSINEEKTFHFGPTPFNEELFKEYDEVYITCRPKTPYIYFMFELLSSGHSDPHSAVKMNIDYVE